MTPIEFAVSRSKVNVTVTFKVKGHTRFTNIGLAVTVYIMAFELIL